MWRTKIQRKHRRGKHWEGGKVKKSIWKFWLLTKWWISVEVVCLQTVSFPGNATRHRHGYQDDRSFLPLGLKREHFVSQDPLNFWNFIAAVDVFIFYLVKTPILSSSLSPGKYFPLSVLQLYHSSEFLAWYFQEQ